MLSMAIIRSRAAREQRASATLSPLRHWARQGKADDAFRFSAAREMRCRTTQPASFMHLYARAKRHFIADFCFS